MELRDLSRGNRKQQIDRYLYEECDGYSDFGDGYIYVLKVRRSADGEIFYYVGETKNPVERIHRHCSFFEATKPVLSDEGMRISRDAGTYVVEELVEIETIEKKWDGTQYAKSLKDRMRNREREKVCEVAIEYGTTNVLGG